MDRAAYGKFYQQKTHAIWRGIPFLMTFEEWFSIWQQSGRWPERGRKRGQYVMARLGDCGAYAIGNVKIITAEDNVAEKACGAETRAKLSAATKAAMTCALRQQISKATNKSSYALVNKKLIGSLVL
jgi:hypothetical protein